MPERTPLTLVSGPLGSGKTTLLQHIVREAPQRIALIINEFGELGIDAAVARSGRNVRIAELDGGCVCCSLIGEFEAAVAEIVDTLAPEAIVVETTGVAEPDALVSDVAEELPQTRVDAVLTVMDADGLRRFPELGSATAIQVETGDLLLLNKVDLVPEAELPDLEARLRALNPRAPILRTRRCRIDLALVFGREREAGTGGDRHGSHQPEVESFTYSSRRPMARDAFERFVDGLDPRIVYRAKGFVRFEDGEYLFNYVGGRAELTPFPAGDTRLVFIGKGLAARREPMCAALAAAER